MKPFDYEAARKGAAICDALGNPVRILCHDLKRGTPLVVAVERNGTESVFTCNYDGSGGVSNLFMAPVKRTAWALMNSLGTTLSRWSEEPITTFDRDKFRLVNLTWEE